MRNISILRYSVIIVAILCVSCGATIPTITPYKLDIQQGNVVTSTMLLQLRPGMTKSQVRFIMGTPLIQDSFHDKRWDYVYQMREKGKVIEQRRVILDFENDLLKTVRGDVVPSGSDVAKLDVAPSNLASLSLLAKDEAKLIEGVVVEKPKVKTDEIKTAEVASNTTELAKENVVPVEETKSILVVPMEVLPTIKAPAPATEVPATVAPVVAVTPVIEPTKIATTKTEPAKVEAGPKKAEVDPIVAVTPVKEFTKVESSPQAVVAVVPAQVSTEVVEEPLLKSTAPTAYRSPLGIKFERSLKFVTPEQNQAVTKPEVVAPRAGNKTIPKAKDLPVESEPSFFDRMLEKIGF